jgi:hypothetical protein
LAGRQFLYLEIVVKDREKRRGSGPAGLLEQARIDEVLARTV